MHSVNGPLNLTKYGKDYLEILCSAGFIKLMASSLCFVCVDL